MNEEQSNILIEWHYIYLTGHYAYWVEASKKSKFERDEMTISSKIYLNVNEFPKYYK